MKRILFLSGLDFKEKSIQVIRKTPEAYAEADWEVDYIVARDNLENGNYFYEDEINIKGVNILRIYWPFPKLRTKLPKHTKLLIGKLSSFITIVKLAYAAQKLLRKNEYDVVYGYELHGVLAMHILKIFFSKNIKTVSRFQGTFLHEMFSKKQYLRLLFNLDLILAIRLNSDLLIMTNDGTQGDKAVRKIKGAKPFNMSFWANGVDLFQHINNPICIKDNKKVFLSVSRLVDWKKVERCLYLLDALKKLGFDNFKYYVVGDGNQKHKLQLLALELDLEDNIEFIGAVNQNQVLAYMAGTDFFLSMYDSSNVGNPLLEAIRTNTIIITLANGDTPSWIQHKYNGYIYDPDHIDFDFIAKDLLKLINDKPLQLQLLRNLKDTENKKLWTWSERMTNEINHVTSL
ncbi:glycosyltransferase family 4 protein [Cocleimonas sp. KMM 6892]|uniref:glycosyltransferase family 4 protein n=1 Tax=unclassified Cocleimonas TaxID=2639732 RepID=UPI002DB64423|nr:MULTISPECIES: glycosyltransferase family 4 protein [unclassified Cocleimonas]MEB8430938.1 glycosyltransferase family 4 protein [Cocleimonas sp. KMM 6892]MEC4714290.1 glycosyltransferase family 4 protein [Cocleimonas sp. KMM 6895]MEC4743621.1 glycosyltransferase family 4 protein [Cocleimonas sp. KMM 6896]